MPPVPVRWPHGNKQPASQSDRAGLQVLHKDDLSLDHDVKGERTCRTLVRPRAQALRQMHWCTRHRPCAELLQGVCAAVFQPDAAGAGHRPRGALGVQLLQRRGACAATVTHDGVSRIAVPMQQAGQHTRRAPRCRRRPQRAQQRAPPPRGPWRSATTPPASWAWLPSSSTTLTRSR